MATVEKVARGVYSLVAGESDYPLTRSDLVGGISRHDFAALQSGKKLWIDDALARRLRGQAR